MRKLTVHQTERRRQNLLNVLYLDAFRDISQADLEPLFGRRYRVLDVGSGTGDWGIEMARTRPDVEVLGIDLVGPDEGLEKPGPNWRFVSEVDFESDDWGPWAEEGEWDLIRCGFLIGCVGDWEKLLGKIRR